MYNSMFFTMEIMKEKKRQGGSWWTQFRRKQCKVDFLLSVWKCTHTESLSHRHSGCVFFFLSDSGNIWLLGCGLPTLHYRHYRHFLMLVCSPTQEELLATRCQVTSPVPNFKPFSVVCLFLICSNSILAAEETLFALNSNETHICRNYNHCKCCGLCTWTMRVNQRVLAICIHVSTLIIILSASHITHT